MANQETFKISAALKDLIGRELITDEFVAVFELVKNSFDANASEVEVIFENNRSENSSKIIIKDNGKGMNYSDLINKWLFVAYSAKKLGIENEDYRDKIKVQRVFAGAKGVGRFSCDRLGEKLNLITKKDEKNAKIENLKVDWRDFENIDDKEFISVKVKHDVLTGIAYELNHGTILEISNLRDNWNRERILKLKRSLVKLINPNQENDSNNFTIQIIAEDELNEDSKPNRKGNEKDEWDIVNGPIKNTVFEALEIKTSNLLVEISEDGSFIESTLQDRGDLIYYLKEKNPFPELRNIKVYLFQLNRKAKILFHKIMGMSSVKYGSVFMYKNGFRVYPYGEEGEDALKIDRRKAQGYNRNLGSRDIIGRIEIYGAQPQLRETTSRDGGLLKTDTYFSLVDFFYEYVLKRLENYVVNIIKWGDEKTNQITGEISPELWPSDVKLEILELITGYINSKDIVEVQYDENFLDILEKKQEKSVNKIIKNLNKVAENSGDKNLVKEAKKIEKAINKNIADTKKATVKAENEEVLRKKTQEELKSEKLKTEFYRKQLAPDADALIHHIKNNNLTIKSTIENLLDDINSNKLDKDELKKDLSYMLFHTDKAIKAASIITHVDLSESDSQQIELNEFIQGYVEHYQEITSKKRIKLKYEHIGDSFHAILSKTELALVIDNLEDNSFKWGAKNVKITTETIDRNTFRLFFSDDGKGLSNNFVKDPDTIFKFGISGLNNGSGLGLNLVKEILERMGAKIKFVDNGQDLKGAMFEITFKR